MSFHFLIILDFFYISFKILNLIVQNAIVPHIILKIVQVFSNKQPF